MNRMIDAADRRIRAVPGRPARFARRRSVLVSPGATERCPAYHPDTTSTYTITRQGDNA